LEAVSGYNRGVFRGMVEEEYLIIHPRGIDLREIERDVYSAVE